MPTRIKMEVFYPKDLYNTDELQRVIRNTLTETAKAVKVDFGATVRTWINKPTFRTKWVNNGWGREISTDSEIYGFVDFGTKPHPITPKRAPMLRFQWGGPGSYKPKTLTRQILSQQGGSTGPIVVALKVDHPGTEAREFSETIAEKWDEELPVQMQRAIDAEVA